MGLGTRELLLIIRGQDELSKVLRGVGGSMGTLSAQAQQAAQKQMALGSAISTVGVGMAAVGAIGVKWLGDAVSTAKTFDTAIALVKTQVDNVNTSQQQLATVSKNVAKSIAAPIDQLNASLYDIFSSMDVTVPQSQQILTGFAKAAVAGQVDVQTAGRATIAILNAWHQPVSMLSQDLDVQFQLVRKGVGTYQEFAQSIGQAIPSAQRAGQSIQTLAGMLAYLTRNGLSTSMAAASAQRALDAFSNPKVVDRLKGMGVAVLNNKGGFNDFGVVIDQLQKKLANMTEPQRTAALQNLFKGAGGTIQAMRFYDTVTQSSTAVKQFTSLTDDMKNSSGALNTAYGTMSNTMTAKTQLLNNQYQLLKVSVGNALIPILTKLIPVIQGIFNWWNSLSGSTQKIIVWIVAATSAFFLVGGAILFIAGTFIMLSAAAALADVALAPIILTVIAVIAGLALLGVAVYELITHWNQVASAVKSVWVPVVNALGAAWNWLWKTILKPLFTWLWSQVGGPLTSLWNSMKSDVSSAMDAIHQAVTGSIGKVGQFINEMIANVTDWWNTHWQQIKGTVQIFVNFWTAIWPYMRGFFSNILYAIMATFRNVWDLIAGIFHDVWAGIVGVIKGAWEIISSVIRGAIDIIEGIFGLFFDIITGRWGQVWGDIVKILKGVWEIIRGVVAGGWEIIEAIFNTGGRIIGSVFTFAWRELVVLFKAGVGLVGNIWDGFVAGLEQAWKTVWNSIIDFFKGVARSIGTLVKDLGSAIGSAWKSVESAFVAPINWVIDIVINGALIPFWNSVMNYLGLQGLYMHDFSKIGGHKEGGLISGAGSGTSDSILSWLSDKEFVVNAKSTAQWLPFLHAINNGMAPGFAQGGQVNANVSQVLGSASISKQASTVISDPYNAVASKGNIANNWLVAGATSGLSLVNRAANFLVGKITKFLGSIGNAFRATPGGSPSAAQSTMYQYASTLFSRYGWAARDNLPALIRLWTKESGWNPFAVNKSSGAYGIPQALGHGHPYNLGDWKAQIQWGENYISGRYGSPLAAWAHEVSHNWYDKGLMSGFVPKGASMMLNGTGADEHLSVMTTSQWSVLDKLANSSTGLINSQTGNTFNITVEGINIYTDGSDPAALGAQLGEYLVGMGARVTQ